LSFVFFFPFPFKFPLAADCFAISVIADAFCRLPMEASEWARVPVLGVFPGAVMALVSSKKGPSLALVSRFVALEELTISVESLTTDDMSWSWIGAGEVRTTLAELIVTFLRFSEEDAGAEEAGGELVLCFPPFFEDRGWSAPSFDSRNPWGGGGDDALRLDVL